MQDVKLLGLAAEHGVYPKSITEVGDGVLFVVKEGADTRMIVTGSASEKFEGAKEGDARVCPLNTQNACALMELLPAYAPRTHRGRRASFGLGDRLGYATPGQLRAIEKTDVFPVIAQQSMRELKLTGRSYPEVIASAAFGALREGWTKGYGADGDHLKKAEEVSGALDAGCTMITLDLSEALDKGAAILGGAELDAAFAQAFGSQGEDILARNSTSEIPGLPAMSKEEIKRYALMYEGALRFTQKVHQSIIIPCGRAIDLEISLDETEEETSPAQHYYVAKELKRRGVSYVSLAPRFPGEFQKAVDYYGNLKELTVALGIHQQIAKALGYKLSVHSGSDKWSAFPMIALATGGHYHLKTSGTNWLEAVKMVAIQNPGLYRKMHTHAITVYSKAQKNYHVSGKVGNVPSLETLSDSELPSLFELDDARQLMHITYGQLLNDTGPDGKPLFRKEIFDTLNDDEEVYARLLERHIGRHLELLDEIK